MKIHQFNADGMIRFQKALEKRDRDYVIDCRLLEDETLIEMVPGGVEVIPRNFVDKGEAGEYLYELFAKLDAKDRDGISSNYGLWSWLSLFFFDTVCPPDTAVRSYHHYVYDPKSWSHFTHHLFVSWRVVNITKQINYSHKLVTKVPVHVRGQVTVGIMSKLPLIRMPYMFEVLDRIYWNENEMENKVRKQFGSEKLPGNFQKRFPKVLGQLEKTYDLQSLNADQLIELLGDEFNFRRGENPKFGM